jgi:peptide/nickel transport system ATP-binding protein
MRHASQVLFDEAAEVSAISEPAVQEEGRHLSFFRLTQIIFQNPYSSLNPRKTVRNIIGVALAQQGIRKAAEQEAETIRLLRRVGLSERHIDSYPHQFSGGQRQRIGIARALAVQPKFIVADEPVSALDVSIQAQVINLLQELQDEYDLTYLFIAHDLSVIHYLSDRVAVMYLGHIVEEAETQSLFDHPQHPYTQALLAAIPQVDRAARRERIILEGNVPSPIDPPRGCPFHTRCFADKRPECELEYPPEVEVGGHRVACWLYV